MRAAADLSVLYCKFLKKFPAMADREPSEKEDSLFFALYVLFYISGNGTTFKFSSNASDTISVSNRPLVGTTGIFISP